MGQLKNHPGKWLRDDAAAQFNALEDAHGVFDVNSAGRTESEQNRLIARWDAGGPANRPPHLYKPARPATASAHVKNGGVAVDIGDDRDRFATVCGAFGFVRPLPKDDPVHFEFVGVKPVTPAPKPKPVAHIATVADLKTLGDTRGLQYVARSYGYKGKIDNDFGPRSQAGFNKFLLAKYGGSIAAWLRAKWGYTDTDDYWGPNMKAAAERANAANLRVNTK